MTEVIAFLAVFYLGYRLLRWGADSAMTHSPSPLFSALAGIPDSNEWSFCFNTDDSMAQRAALKRAAKDLRIRIKFARPRGGHAFMIGVFVASEDSKKAYYRLSDRRYDILAGRLEYHICQTCGYEGGDWHYEGCAVGLARGDQHFEKRRP